MRMCKRMSAAWMGVAVVLAGGALAGEEAGAPPLLDPAVEKPGLKVGDAAPNVTLVNAFGTETELSEFLEEGPVVVTFYRGGWCPFCVRAMKEWAEKQEELESAGATLVFISMESLDHAGETDTKVGAAYEVMVDPTGEASRAFRVAFALDEETREKYKGYGINLEEWNATGRWELPAPATFVIDKGGVVRWVFADWDYKKRAKPEDVIAAVKALE